MQPEQPCKKLYRSNKQRMLAGVCGGLAEYFNIDPTWVRLFFVFFFFAFGSAILLYIVLWILMPESPDEI